MGDTDNTPTEPELAKRLVQISSRLEGFARIADRYRELTNYDWTDDALLAREVEEAKKYAHHGWGEEEPLKLALLVPSMCLFAARDHIETLRQVIQHERAESDLIGVPIYGPRVVARALLETTARAWWILDPTIDVRERIERGITDVIQSLRSQRTALIEIPKDVSPIDDRLARIRGAADATGFICLDDDKGRLCAIGSARLNDLDIVDRLLKDQGGRTAYRSYASVHHAMLLGLVDGLEATWDHERAKQRIFSSPLGAVEHLEGVCAFGGLGFAKAFDREVDLYGWDPSTWQSYRDDALDVLLTPLRNSDPS